ncbi:hypothetical protein BCR43DRAFT_524453 [Syncephalastrum racemosum]|uniref:Uncharacterized protein n=1 Tax=Syncephalastrum racemosum TaxID=13706 RepID=A0A1X2HC62_SYNRA|nr:hypothetical protein BCR43DRAFT_524453 [Syncephalastrum racemosum]
MARVSIPTLSLKKDTQALSMPESPDDIVIYGHDDPWAADHEDEDEDEEYEEDSSSSPDTEEDENIKVMSLQDKKFDLAAFARQLHQNRLSVVQPRQSLIIMTEQDEQELARLVTKARRREEKILVEMNEGDIECQERQQQQQDEDEEQEQEQERESMKEDDKNEEKRDKETTEAKAIEQDDQRPLSRDVSESGTITHDHHQPEENLSPPPTPPHTQHKDENENTVSSVLLHKASQARASSPPVRSPRFIQVQPTPSLSDPGAFLSPRPAPTPPTSTAAHRTSGPRASLDKLRLLRQKTSDLWRSDSVDSLKSTKKQAALGKSAVSRHGSEKILVEDDERHPQRPGFFHHYQSNQSTASSNSSQTRFKELPELAVDPATLQELTDTPHIPRKARRSRANTTTVPRTASKLGLFGSLRQQATRTRSQSSSSIRGLMRNLSTSTMGSTSSRAHRRNTNDVPAVVIPTTPSPSISSPLSPAALAVLKHDGMTTPPTSPKRTSTSANGKAMRKLSQLLSRASMSRRSRASPATKAVNLEEEEEERERERERARLVRRTIIYVQPDSLQYLQSLGDESPESDEGEPKLQQATMVKRQTSMKRQASIKRRTEKQLEGLELREMSDGSVTWDIVQQEDGTSTPSSPPPVPKRSPRRRQATADDTDVYYAPDTTLPSLLQMISDVEMEVVSSGFSNAHRSSSGSDSGSSGSSGSSSYAHAGEQQPRLHHSPSIEEQLDEAIRELGLKQEEGEEV